MTKPDFRALCAELLQPLAEYDGANPYHEHRDLITRARAALAAEPEPPADGEVAELVTELKLMASDAAAASQTSDAQILTRAADLLERLAVAVPVAAE
jgi:hypothetical protein